MSRIDVQTLVLAFEKRIAALEVNPPSQVSTGVIINLLERAIDDVIREHFIELAKRDIEKLIKKELKNYHEDFISKTVTNILTNQIFRDTIENKIKNIILGSICKIKFDAED